MGFRDYKPGLIGLATSFGASLCCALPLAIVVAGLGSGAFMFTTMQFRPILYPLGLIGLAAAWFLFWREKRRCDALACRMTGGRVNLVLVVLSTVMMVVVTYVDFFLVEL